MKIKVNKSRCSGCHICEMVCSLYHTGKINPERAAIRVFKDDLDTSINVPKVCRQCKEMKCIKGEAIQEWTERETFLWDEKRAEKCSFGALSTFEGKAYHCDLCGGDPQCVKVCPPGAIYLSKDSIE